MNRPLLLSCLGLALLGSVFAQDELRPAPIELPASVADREIGLALPPPLPPAEPGLPLEPEPALIP